MQWKKWKEVLLKGKEENSVDKKKLNPLIVGGIILAIALLAGSSIFGSGKKAASPKQTDTVKELSPPKAEEDYLAQVETRLSEALSQIKGAGKVSVIVSVEDGGEKVLATDSKSKSEHRTENDSSDMSTEQEENAVMTGQGSGQQPFVVKEKKPNPSGVIVIAEGAGDETVRYELYEAVKALYGISPHRIKVVTAQK